MFRKGSSTASETRRAFREAPKIDWKKYHQGVVAVAKFVSKKPRLSKPQQALAHFVLFFSYIGMLSRLPGFYGLISPVIAICFFWTIGTFAGAKRMIRRHRRYFEDLKAEQPYARENESSG